MNRADWKRSKGEPWVRWYDRPFLGRLGRVRWVFLKHWHPKVRWYARVRAATLILCGHETEICGLCGGKVGLVWHAPDELWLSLSGFPGDAGVLCLPCFDRQAEAKGISLCWESAAGVWPSCAGNPCPHEESMMIARTQREQLWESLPEDLKRELREAGE